MSDFDLLSKGDFIKSRWRITHKIGGGGFGQIYQAYDKLRQELVAVKVESNSQPRQGIRMEVTVLRRIQNRQHICELLSGGVSTLYNYMVMTLLGSSLSELRRSAAEQRFTLSTTLRISLQMLEAIESVHTIGFLHRDIKPSNFAIGRTNVRQIFILDFGLARKYTDYDQHVRPARAEAGFRGTIRYASVNAHNNRELGRHDDLWSFFYMLVEFLLGSLPWSKMKDKESVGRMKESYDYNRFLANLPEEFERFLTHVNELNYEDRPDYELLRSLIHCATQRLGYHEEDPYDWEKCAERDESDSLGKIEPKRVSSQREDQKGLQDKNSNERMHPLELNSRAKQLKQNRPLPKPSSRTGLSPNLLVPQYPHITNHKSRTPFDFDRMNLDVTGTGDQAPSSANNRSPDTLARRSTLLNPHDHGQATSNGLLTYVSQQFSNAVASGAPSVFSHWSPHRGETLTDDDLIKGTKSSSSRADERGTTLSGERALPHQHRSENIVEGECYHRPKSQRSIGQNVQVPFGTYTKNTRRNTNHNRRRTSPSSSLQRFTRKKSDRS